MMSNEGFVNVALPRDLHYQGGPLDAARISEREKADKARTERLLKFISPPGTLGLPKLLDERRIEYGITDGAFKRQAVFDRVLVYQIPMQKGDKYQEDSLIHLAESTQQRERNRAPHGIVISAGLKALDSLRSHGIDIGHRVLFAHTAPYHVRYDVVEGREFHLVVLQDGDIIASEDLAENLRERRVFFKVNRTEDGLVTHTYQDENGKTWLPQDSSPGEF